MGRINDEKDTSLQAKVRPGSLDVVGQQTELFPFDAFNFEYDPSNDRYIISLKNPWEFYLSDPEGFLGGWTISSNSISATADLDGDGTNDDNLIVLNSEKRRIEVWDNTQPTQVLKIALGYLDGIESYTSNDYGLYLNDPNVARIDGGGESRSGDWLIKADAAYTILNSSEEELARFGSLGGGEVGLEIGPVGNRFFTANESGLTLTGTITAASGNIGGWSIGSTTLSSGTMYIDSANERITINDTVFGNAGIQIDYNSGTPRFHVGDGTKYISFDGIDLTFDAGNTSLDSSGNITATGGNIGGWDILSNLLKDSSNQVVLNADDKRVEVKDNVGNIKVALGYLENVDTYTANDYGLWIGAPNTVHIEGDGDYSAGDWTIRSDAAYVIEDSSNTERGRFGSVGTGTVGLRVGTIDEDADTGAGIYADENGVAKFRGDGSGATNIDGGNIQANTINLSDSVIVGSMPQLSDEGLVAHWSFDDGSATTVVDNSGNGNNATNNGATSVEGISGKAFYADSGEYIDLGNVNDLFADSGESWSFTDWFNVSSTDTLLDNGNIKIEVYSTFYMRITIRGEENYLEYSPSGATMMGITWDGSTAEFYMSGKQSVWETVTELFDTDGNRVLDTDGNIIDPNYYYGRII